MNKPPQEWSKIKEGQTTLGLKFLITMYKYLGVWALDTALYFVAAYYFLFKQNVRQSSQQFLCRVRSYRNEPAPSLWQSYIHILNFARAASDKITVWMGRYSESDIHFHGYEKFKECKIRGQGVFIIASHLGNVDVCRSIGAAEMNIPLNVLTFSNHAENFNQLMAEETGNIDAINIIEVQNITPDIAILLLNKIKDGENVIITGDRTPIQGTEHIEMVPFLGADAPFAHGPFVLGGLLDCPVFTMFVIRMDDGYHLYMREFANTLKTSREDRAVQTRIHITRYVKILEEMAQLYPLQWYNFYNYWGNRNG